MRRWREYETGIVHGFSPIHFSSGNDFVHAFCGERLRLSYPGGFYILAEVPTGKRLTRELPSVKTQLTCIGCIAAGK